jgi:hypothetical protein
MALGVHRQGPWLCRAHHVYLLPSLWSIRAVDSGAALTNPTRESSEAVLGGLVTRYHDHPEIAGYDL